MVVAVKKLAVVQVNLWVLAVVANRLAVAVVVVRASAFPPVVQFRGEVLDVGAQLEKVCRQLAQVAGAFVYDVVRYHV